MPKKNSPAKKPVTETEDQDTEGQEQEGSGQEQEEQEPDGEDENRRINAIVTNRVKREMKGVLSQLTQMQELIKTLAQPKQTEADEDEDQEPAKKPAEDPKALKKLTKLERELAEERAERIKAQKERAEEHEKARRNEMRNLFQSALAEHGVSDPRLMRAALDQLEQDGYMVREEDGKVKFKGQDKYGIETNFDPKTGIKTWIQQEGKSFVPAVDVGGSGTGPARGNAANVTKGDFGKMTPAQKAAIEIDRASQGLPPLE